MKLLFLAVGLGLGAEICYPLVGCFTDDPPFSIPEYRPRRLPVDPDTSITEMRLTNRVVFDEIFDWKNPLVGTTFMQGEKVHVMTHGCEQEWDDTLFLNDARVV